MTIVMIVTKQMINMMSVAHDILFDVRLCQHSLFGPVHSNRTTVDDMNHVPCVKS